MTRVLALDVGTSSVRAFLYDAEGRRVEGVEAQTPYGPLDEAVGADELLAAANGAFEEVRREAGGSVDAVAASCFWHSLLAVDAAGRSLTPVLTWRDTRAAREAEELAAAVGAEAAHARTGCPLHPSFWPAKLLWLRRREPAAYRAAARFVSFGEYLLGQPRTSFSMAAGTGLFGLDGRWDAELLEAVGVEEERLPEVSDEPVGTRLPPLGDGACSNVGVGAVTAGRGALTIGTSGALRLLRGPGPPPPPGLFLYRLDESRFVEGGAVSDGGNLVDWLERALRLEDVSGLATDPPATGPVFLPLLGGERSPGWDARARGAIGGLAFDTTPRDIFRAALEGVAFRFAEIAERMDGLRELVATGGALRGRPDWVQILADVLGFAIELSPVTESSARGAAVVALERLGEQPAPLRPGRTFAPRDERAEAYRWARTRQRELYECVT